jgi:hypothetical protein
MRPMISNYSLTCLLYCLLYCLFYCLHSQCWHCCDTALFRLRCACMLASSSCLRVSETSAHSYTQLCS